jgi:DNA-binding MarR family transcriptional regulator
VAPDCPGRLIDVTTQRLVADATRQRAARAALLGLTATDLLAVHHIGRRQDLTPGELARLLALSSGGTTAVIDRLRRAGLVTRTTASGGRRRVLLALTADARARATAQPVADLDALAAELSQADRAIVERFLARLADRAEQHADQLAEQARQATAAARGAPSPVLWG